MEEMVFFYISKSKDNDPFGFVDLFEKARDGAPVLGDENTIVMMSARWEGQKLPEGAIPCAIAKAGDMNSFRSIGNRLNPFRWTEPGVWRFVRKNVFAKSAKSNLGAGLKNIAQFLMEIFLFCPLRKKCLRKICEYSECWDRFRAIKNIRNPWKK